MLWAGVVLALLIYQLISYRGIVARLVEWQFATFDISFPVLTMIAIVIILTSPFVLILMYRMNKARSNPRLKKPEAAVHRASMMQRFLGWISIVLAVCAVCVALYGLTVGGTREKPLPVSWADIEAGRASEGAVVLSGAARYDRLGFFEDRLLFVGRVLWVTPVQSRGSNSGIYLFAETEEHQARPFERRELRGILRRAGVPGELRRLYENAGYSVEQPTYLLFKSLASARAPYFSAAKELGTGALIFLIFFIFQNRRRRRLVKEMNNDEGS